MKAIIPIFLALALAAASPARAADFFGVPDKTVVPKPVATPVPAPARDTCARHTRADPRPGYARAHHRCTSG